MLIAVFITEMVILHKYVYLFIYLFIYLSNHQLLLIGNQNYVNQTHIFFNDFYQELLPIDINFDCYQLLSFYFFAIDYYRFGLLSIMDLSIVYI